MCHEADHLIHAGPDISQHVSFVFTCMATLGSVPNEFGVSTILPIPKSFNSNSIDSANFRGITLSSIFCKLLDNIILEKFHDKLCTSDHQFDFKPKIFTNMCTIVLKETLSYYSSNQSSVYCTFLDASKACNRLQYCKLFRILIRRGLPACIVRILLYYISQAWCGYYGQVFFLIISLYQMELSKVALSALFCFVCTLMIFY